MNPGPPADGGVLLTAPKSPVPAWTARTGAPSHPLFASFSESTTEDEAYLRHDIAGSIAHVAGLHAAGLLSADDAAALIDALQALAAEHEAGAWRLDPGLEDVHMNTERRVTEAAGEAGRRLHTGRSRNDQVAACLVLHARAGLLRLAEALDALCTALTEQAARHLETPWTARTHGQNAQPATLGFLLAAHAWRIHDATADTLHALGRISESPLGCGAVAGSTLPLQPHVPAALLGLRPPRNALLSTGTRDASLTACRAAAAAGTVLAGLAQELLGLHAAGSLHLGEGWTTGSSLMPHKRNPDPLELARGRCNALAGPLAAVQAIVQGAPLGYLRDFQVVKPHQHAALSDAAATAGLLAACLHDARFQPAPAAAEAATAATDMAEALVHAGMPFRDAYTLLARAFAAAEDGTPLEAALSTAGLEAPLVAAALAAATPDASRRDTPAGPAPRRVAQSLAGLEAARQAATCLLSDAHAAVARAENLLTEPASRVLLQATEGVP